jgi:hypothetical protein
VRFDDRLRTVLAQPASDPHDRAVRWRQLVELVARAGPDTDTDLLERALRAIRDDTSSVNERVRTAAALAVGSLPLPAGLVAAFASDKLSVAAPVLAGARLTAGEWTEVAASASHECRAFIATMRPDAAQPPEAPPPPARASAGNEAAVPSIGEVVARIEKLRRSREEPPAPPPADKDPDNAAPRLFRWECNESGEIEWVEGAPRGALVGQSVAQCGLDGGVDKEVERAFAARAPFHEGTLELSRGGVTSGTWKISGVPAFEPASGRFAGYRGIAERPATSVTASADTSPDVDSLRELAHEIKTPLNAIIGFAEIINGEYLGPADSRRRERAAEIVAQARVLLAAVEDMDLAARSKAGEGSAVADLTDVLAAVWEEIERRAGERDVRILVESAEETARCAVEPQLARRLVERLCFAVIDAAGPGEQIGCRIGSNARCCALEITRPASLAGTELRPERNRRAGDTVTLPLRLVAGLARTAGGEVEAADDRLVLRLPIA